MKYARLESFGRAGIYFFLVVLLAGVFAGLLFPRILVSTGFAQQIRPYAILGWLWAGSGFACVFAAKRLRGEKIVGSTGSAISDRGWIVISTLVSFGFAYLVYAMLYFIPAVIMHNASPRQTVKFEATALGASTHRFELRPECRAGVWFANPAVDSYTFKSACIDWNQWLYFRAAPYPFPIEVCGFESAYGYELGICQ